LSLNDTRWRRTAPDLAGTGVRLRTRHDARGTYYVFEVRWNDPITKRKFSEQFDTPQDALDFKAHQRLLKRRDALSELDRGRETLDTFAAEWLEQHAATHLSNRSLRSYAGLYDRHLGPRIGRLELRQLRPRVIDQLQRAMLDDGVGSPTVRKSLAVLSSMLGQAVIWDRIDANCVRAVRKPSGRRRKVIHPLSVLDVERLIWHLRDAGDQRSAMLVELIAYTGARPQDALALAFTEIGERIHFAFKVVDGQRVAGTKTGTDRTRSVEALPTLRRDLLAYRAAMPGASAESLVIPRDDDRPWHDHDYKNWGRKAARGKVRKKDGARTGQPGPFERARIAAGLADDITPYYLRHTYASLRIAEQRLSLQEIAEELGHSLEVLAEHYAHVISEYAGKGKIDPEKLIQEARRGVAAGDTSRRPEPQSDAASTYDRRRRPTRVDKA
jgi:integrase